MAISADTNAIVHSNYPATKDDPAQFISGFPALQGAIMQSRKSNFSVTNLGTTTKKYTSTFKSDIQALAYFYANLGATYEIEEGPYYTITVVLPYDEFTTVDSNPAQWSLWEIVPNQIERSMYDIGIYSPTVANGQISTTRQTLNLTQKAAVDYAAKNPTLNVNLAVTNDPAWIAKQYVAQNFLALERLKTTSVMSFTQTLKRSVIFYSRNNITFTDPIIYNGGSYGGTVVDSNTLISLYNIPTNITPYMQTSYARTRTISGQDGVALVALAGYLVKPPTYQLISPHKIQFTQEFVWDEWLDSLYYPYLGNYGAFVNIS